MQTEKEYMTGREVLGLRCESTGEYSLPDYNGDVRKVLLVRPKVFPTGKFVGDGVLELSGIVEYEVLYLDSENVLTRAQFSTDYDAALRINPETYVDSDVATEISSYSARLTGPRRFSVKATLDSTVAISESRMLTVGGDAFMEYEPEYVGESAKVLSMAFASADARELTEEMATLDGAIADEIEILLTDAHATASAESLSDVGLTVKGCVKVDMLYAKADGDPIRIEKEIPYSEEVSLGEATDFDDVATRLEITSIKSGVVPTEDGVRITCAVSVTPRVCAKRNTVVNLVSDAFLKERGSENEYGDFVYTEYVCAECREERHEHKHSLSELDVTGITAVLYPCASARVDSCTADGDTVKIGGEIRFSAVAVQEDSEGDRICTPVKFSAPFEQNVNLGCQITDDMHISCHADVRDISMNVDADHIDSSFLICASVSVTADRKRRCLTASFVTDEEYAHDGSIVTVYYPDASESLFEIARRFHTCTRSIAESNRLTETVFSSTTDSLGALGVTKLIIR